MFPDSGPWVEGQAGCVRVREAEQTDRQTDNSRWRDQSIFAEEKKPVEEEEMKTKLSDYR